MSSRLPDIIGIGTRRCGSSWLHEVLNSHPEIGKPPNGVHYFSQHRELGFEWYANKLAPYASRKILLEFSVSYLYPEYHQTAAKCMHDAVPNAKIFVCVRNPVQRAHSDYLRSVRMNEIPANIDFATAIRHSPALLDRGHYAKLLSPYIDLFPRDQIKILFFEDLNKNPSEFASELASFIGLQPNFAPHAIQRSEPKGKTVRSQWINHTIRGIKGVADEVMCRIGYADQWSNWKRRHVRKYERALDLTHRSIEMDRILARELSNEFRDDIEFLESFTDRNLKDWHE